jgi:hypothetical protein
MTLRHVQLPKTRDRLELRCEHVSMTFFTGYRSKLALGYFFSTGLTENFIQVRLGTFSLLRLIH